MAAPARTSRMGPDVLNTGGWDDLPEQVGSRPELFQPGPYRFKLPSAKLLREAVEEFTTKADGKDDQVRIKVGLRNGRELVVTQSPANANRNGETFATTITNAGRNRARKDDTPRYASDLDYLLKALEFPKRPQTNAEYKDAVIAMGEKEFGADVTLSARCRADRPIRVEAEGGGTVLLDGEEGLEKQEGCGKAYYQRDLDKDAETGKYPRSIVCECGAILYLNENLENFRK